MFVPFRGRQGVLCGPVLRANGRVAWDKQGESGESLGTGCRARNGAPGVGHEFARTGRDHASGVGKWATGQRQQRAGTRNEAMQAAAGQVGDW